MILELDQRTGRRPEETDLAHSDIEGNPATGKDGAGACEQQRDLQSLAKERRSPGKFGALPFCCQGARPRHDQVKLRREACRLQAREAFPREVSFARLLAAFCVPMPPERRQLRAIMFAMHSTLRSLSLILCAEEAREYCPAQHVRALCTNNLLRRMNPEAILLHS
jgi:hypothetical protein